MFDTIIVPIDMAHTEVAERMITAAKEAKNDGGRIILLNVVDVMPDYTMVYLPDNALNDIEKDAKEKLQQLSDEHGGGEFEIRLENGGPGYTIVDVAEETKADAIIIASHKPGMSDYFIGSTAARVVRHAKCSVLVLR